MSGMVAFLGLAIGSPYHHDDLIHKAVTCSLLAALALSSSLISFGLCPYTKPIYFGSILAVSALLLLCCILFSSFPDALLLGTSIAPFAILFLGSFLPSPWLELATASYALACVYLYVSNSGSIDLPASLVSAYCLSACLVYGLLSSPEALAKEYTAPFFRIIGANDTVLKFTLSGLLLIVWLFRSLVRDESAGAIKKPPKYPRFDNHPV